jgi:hypothetical protein
MFAAVMARVGHRTGVVVVVPCVAPGYACYMHDYVYFAIVWCAPGFFYPQCVGIRLANILAVVGAAVLTLCGTRTAPCCLHLVMPSRCCAEQVTS